MAELITREVYCDCVRTIIYINTMDSAAVANMR